MRRDKATGVVPEREQGGEVPLVSQMAQGLYSYGELSRKGANRVQALGTHLLVELRECNEELLDDVKKVKEMMVSAAKEAKATVIGAHFHRFSPHGVSGVVVIAESHLSIHTWPEYGYAAVDVFTCGDVLQPSVAAAFLIKKFQSKNPSLIEVKRGTLSLSDQKLPHKPEKGAVVDHDRDEELQMVS